MFHRNFIVLELANILGSPITTMFFAELGARVIKLEDPHTGGDTTRGWKLSSECADSDISAYFSCANWGKESLACDSCATNPALGAPRRVATRTATKKSRHAAAFSLPLLTPLVTAKLSGAHSRCHPDLPLRRNKSPPRWIANSMAIN